MIVKELINKLKRIDRRIVFVPGPNKQSGIYKFEPRHPDSHANGLKWIGSCPSPHMFFGKLEPFDWYDLEHKANEYHRGWRKIVSLLVGNGHITASQATSQFGWQWRHHVRPNRD